MRTRAETLAAEKISRSEARANRNLATAQQSQQMFVRAVKKGPQPAFGHLLPSGFA
jgi:hypothetical protein